MLGRLFWVLFCKLESKCLWLKESLECIPCTTWFTLLRHIWTSLDDHRPILKRNLKSIWIDLYSWALTNSNCKFRLSLIQIANFLPKTYLFNCTIKPKKLLSTLYFCLGGCNLGIRAVWKTAICYTKQCPAWTSVACLYVFCH